MRTRPLRWEDVKAEISTRFDGLKNPPIPYMNRKGETRVYASLHLCSFVGETMWIQKPDLNNPALRAVILLKLQRNLRKAVHRLKAYEAQDNTPATTP